MHLQDHQKSILFLVHYYIILFRGVLDTILRQMSPSHHNQPSEMFFPFYLEGLTSFLDADLVYKNHHHIIAVCATYASQHLSFHNPSVVFSVVFIQKVVQGSFIFPFVLVIVWNLHVYYINRLKYVSYGYLIELVSFQWLII